MEGNANKVIKNIAIVGGTHGNEFTGVYLIHKLKQAAYQKQFPNLSLHFVCGNPKAYQKRVRFLDQDLNRSFSDTDLANPDLWSYEANRAKVLQQQLGPQGALNIDLIIDLHTTTANMGVTLALAHKHAYDFQMAAYLQSHLEDVYLYHTPSETYAGGEEHLFLNAIAPHGCVLEVGPIANALVRHDILEKTENAILKMLEFIDLNNQSKIEWTTKTVDVYQHVKIVPFPVDQDGNICAVIHQAFQDSDFRRVKKGDPIFYTLDQQTIRFNEDGEYYPAFINEAAYYYTKTAFTLTRKLHFSLGNAENGASS